AGSRHSRSTFRSIVSSSKGAGAPPHDPSHVAVPLHEAWQALLEGFLPHLLAEAEGAAGWLLLWKGEEEAARGQGGARGGGRSGGGGGGKAGGKRHKKGRRRRRAAEEEEQEEEGEQEEEEEGAGEDLQPQQRRSLSRQGREVIAALLAGVDTEFMALADLAAKSQQVMCLPMMALATACIGALVTRGSVAAPLRAALATCHARLRGHFGRFVEAQRAAVDSYGSRLAAGGSVKSYHVINFVSQFALMAHHIEVMLSEGADALLSQLSGGVASAAATAAAAAAALATGGGGSDGEEGDEEENEEENEEEEEEEGARRRDVLLAAATWQVRPEVDALYGSLVGLMFGSLERIAGADAKHGDRFRAENYGYFVEAVRPLVRHVASLEPYMLQAEAKQEESIRRYVSAQLQYTNLGRLGEAVGRLEGLLALLAPREVAYQAGCSAGEMRALIAACGKDADKKIQKMYGRVRRHLGTSGLAFRVWERIYEELMNTYRRLEEQLGLCYPSLQLDPAPEQLAELFRSVVGPAAASP
ncbi:hypothetical protein Agub_g6633, partial [Astrephomene gubernaculifera]